MKSPRTLVAGVVAVALGLAGGVLIGTTRNDRSGDVAALRAEVEALGSKVARLDAERDRLRLERNELEARLASEKPRAICPQDWVSTGAAELLPFFEVDYPCGWHVLFDARSAISAEEGRPGMHVEVALFSRLPISLRPRQEPIADIELADWSDDPADGRDDLPSLDAWLGEERDAFDERPREERFEVGDGVTVHRLVGTQTLFDDPVEVHVMVWEYEDAVSGQRHIVRVFSLAPSAVVRRALDRMARSFTVLGP